MSTKNSKGNKKESTNGEVHKKLKIYKGIYTVRGGSLTIYPQKTQKDTKENPQKTQKDTKENPQTEKSTKDSKYTKEFILFAEEA